MRNFILALSLMLTRIAYAASNNPGCGLFDDCGDGDWGLIGIVVVVLYVVFNNYLNDNNKY